MSSFVCALCRKTVSLEGHSNEMERQEYADTFRPYAGTNVPSDEVCDACYKAFMKWYKRFPLFQRN